MDVVVPGAAAGAEGEVEAEEVEAGEGLVTEEAVVEVVDREVEEVVEVVAEAEEECKL